MIIYMSVCRTFTKSKKAQTYNCIKIIKLKNTLSEGFWNSCYSYVSQHLKVECIKNFKKEQLDNTE